jgi:hypothetical protein
MSNITKGINYEIQLKYQNSNCVNCDYFSQNGSGAILSKIVTVDTIRIVVNLSGFHGIK